MSGFKGTQLYIPTVKMILNQDEPLSPVCASVYHWESRRRLSHDDLLGDFFWEQRGEDVNKGWINRWISWELRTGPIGRPSDSY